MIDEAIYTHICPICGKKHKKRHGNSYGYSSSTCQDCWNKTINMLEQTKKRK